MKLIASYRSKIRLPLLAFAFVLAFAPIVSASTLELSNGQAATLVLGQPSLTSEMPTTSRSGMATPVAVAVDPASGRLFVADTGNHRVLRFASAQALSNGAPAEAVLGQATFTDNTPAAGEGMNGPLGVAVDSAGRLWVADTGNNRVLRFDSPLVVANGAPADGVLGQPNLLSTSPGTMRHTMSGPFGVFVDVAGRLYVADSGNARVLRFDDAANKHDGAEANGVLGQRDFESNIVSSPDSSTMAMPAGVWGDGAGRLWVTDFVYSRVLRFDDAANKSNGAAADGVLGQLTFTSALQGTARNRLSFPVGVSVDPSGRLYVAEDDNNRVVWFDNAAQRPNGADADGVLGQPTFSSDAPYAGGLSATKLHRPTGVAYDPTSGTLYVADFWNSRVVRYGTVIAAGYSSRPAPGDTLDLGRASVMNPASASLEIREIGSADLTLDATISGPGAHQFRVTPSSARIADGAPPQILTITCIPVRPGDHRATLTVRSNSGASPASYALTCQNGYAVFLPVVTR